MWSIIILVYSLSKRHINIWLPSAVFVWWWLLLLFESRERLSIVRDGVFEGFTMLERWIEKWNHEQWPEWSSDAVHRGTLRSPDIIFLNKWVGRESKALNFCLWPSFLYKMPRYNDCLGKTSLGLCPQRTAVNTLFKMYLALVTPTPTSTRNPPQIFRYADFYHNALTSIHMGCAPQTSVMSSNLLP